MSMKLWASWADDAVIGDEASGRYADITRLRPIDHSGSHFRVRRRGLFRTEHTGQTLRDHYGIPRPPGRASERGADARPVPVG